MGSSTKYVVEIRYATGRTVRYRKPTREAAEKTISQLIAEYGAGKLAPYWNGSEIRLLVSTETVEPVDGYPTVRLV